MSRRGRPPHPDILTPREWEVLALLRERLSNEEIAQRLDISLAGAKYHVSEILGKLAVSSREEAAQWQQPERPWWTAAGAPVAFFWRRASVSWLTTGIAGAFVLAAVAGIGLLVWGLLRTDGDVGERMGTANPSTSVGDLLACYRERPTSAESLAASQSLRGARVSVGGKEVGERASEEMLSLLGDAEPVYFGVRALPGTRIGEPGRLGETTVLIDLGTGELSFKYVHPGPLASYGLLFDPDLINAWELVTMLSPAGYAQLACAVPPEFDQVMANLGFEGYDPEGILEARVVPLSEAQRDIRIDRMEVWNASGARQVLALPLPDALYAEGSAGAPIEPFAGTPLNVEVWYKGVDPFPEAIKPATYLYYSGDASESGLGVLVPIEAAVVHNGTLGRPESPTFYAAPELDYLLREIFLIPSISKASTISSIGMPTTGKANHHWARNMSWSSCANLSISWV